MCVLVLSGDRCCVVDTEVMNLCCVDWQGCRRVSDFNSDKCSNSKSEFKPIVLALGFGNARSHCVNIGTLCYYYIAVSEYLSEV